MQRRLLTLKDQVKMCLNEIRWRAQVEVMSMSQVYTQ